MSHPLSYQADQAKSYEVVVIGGGLAGLSSLYHLQRAGIKAAISVESFDAAITRHAAGFAVGGQIDNFTRISHAQGQDLASHLWRLGDTAYDALERFCAAEAVPFHARRRMRLITSEAEFEEAKKAIALMEERGLAAKLLAPTPDLGPRVLGIQDDGPRGAYVDIPRLLGALDMATASAPRLSATHTLENDANGILLHHKDGASTRSEIVIVAAHFGTGDLLPQLRPALIPVADQWSKVKLSAPGAAAWKGCFFSANHTYEWGVFVSSDTAHIGGGRYLRPLAGIEAETAHSEPKITEHLLTQFGKTFRFGTNATPIWTAATRDIRPCDEMPIIGPMFGDGRILVAVGFMGAGLTLGFQAGASLANLVKHGRCDALPRALWPERLRTLES